MQLGYAARLPSPRSHVVKDFPPYQINCQRLKAVPPFHIRTLKKALVARRAPPKQADPRLRPRQLQQLEPINRKLKRRRGEARLAARFSEKRTWISLSVPLPRTSVCVCCFGMFLPTPEPRGVSSPCSLINRLSPPEKMAPRHRCQNPNPNVYESA